jgi:hypothetical protein
MIINVSIYIVRGEHERMPQCYVQYDISVDKRKILVSNTAAFITSFERREFSLWG